jgi:hypothetical protein
VREHPILFSGEMVRAILEGRKTMTRRVIKAPKGFAPEYAGVDFGCPYGVPGDRLWVRETWQIGPELQDVIYAADEKWNCNGVYIPPAACRSWKPSIHMPRWASRITLEITGVRAERVKQITGSNLYAEGFPGEAKVGSCFGWFVNLWDSLNAKRGFGWDVNPWVWIIEFRRTT